MIKMKYFIIYLVLYNVRNHGRSSQCCPEFLSRWQALSKPIVLCNFHHGWKDGIKEIEAKRDGGMYAGWEECVQDGKSDQPC